MLIILPNQPKLQIAIAIYNFSLHSSYGVEVMGSKSYVDKQWHKRLGFFHWVKGFFRTGSVHNKHSRLCQRLAGRISDAHTHTHTIFLSNTTAQGASWGHCLPSSLHLSTHTPGSLILIFFLSKL